VEPTFAAWVGLVCDLAGAAAMGIGRSEGGAVASNIRGAGGQRSWQIQVTDSMRDGAEELIRNAQRRCGINGHMSNGTASPIQEVPMSTKQLSNDAATEASKAAAVPMRLEAVVVRVADVDRANRFHQRLGWRVDVDVSAGDDYRLMHLTPPASNASILFGKGVTSAPPGSIDSLVLAVDDIDVARDELLSRGVDVSEVFHDDAAAAGFIAGTEARAAGPDSQDRSYATYASFSDPDGNRWLLQEITERAPGRV
jgi:hypothetical protein